MSFQNNGIDVISDTKFFNSGMTKTVNSQKILKDVPGDPSDVPITTSGAVQKIFEVEFSASGSYVSPLIPNTYSIYYINFIEVSSAVSGTIPFSITFTASSQQISVTQYEFSQTDRAQISGSSVNLFQNISGYAGSSLLLLTRYSNNWTYSQICSTDPTYYGFENRSGEFFQNSAINILASVSASNSFSGKLVVHGVLP